MTAGEGKVSKRTSKVPYVVSHSQGGHSVEAYRGYLIQPAFMGDVFYIQKEGFTVGSAKTNAEARQTIDLLVG